MLLGDARDALDEPRSTRARSSTEVPFERTTTVSPVAIPRRSASAADSSSSRSGRWNWSSGTRSTCGPGEERPVAEEPELADEVLAGLPPAAAGPSPGAGSGRVVRRRARERRLLAERCEVDAAEDPAGELVEHDRGMRRERRRRSARRASRSTRARRGRAAITARRRRCRRPSRFIASRRARASPSPAGRGRPSRRRATWNIVIAITCVGPLGERADARVGRRLVAGDDEQPDRPRARLVLVRRGGPRLGDAAPVRRRGKVERARSRACPRSRARARPRRAARRRRRPGPTRSGPRARRHAAACRARFSPSASSAARRPPRPAAAGTEPRAPIVTSSAPLRRACLSQRSTTGARSTTSSSPTTTTSSAAPIVESGARNASSAADVDSGSTAECAPRPRRRSAREPVRLLDRLGAGERGHDRRRRRRGGAPRRGRARRPTRRAPGRARRGRAARACGRRRSGAGR